MTIASFTITVSLKIIEKVLEPIGCIVIINPENIPAIRLIIIIISYYLIIINFL
jgi:hypothetical protein